MLTHLRTSLITSLLLLALANLQAQSTNSIPGTLVVCPMGEFDGHHHVPMPQYIMEKMQSMHRSSGSRDNCSTIDVTYIGFPPAAQTAFEHAKEIWENTLTSSVTIRVEATWANLGANTLGSAGPNNLFWDFAGAPDGRIYPSALANALAGFDLDPGEPHILVNINSTADWYLGVDGNAPFDEFDFVSVVLHELGHGLGFSSSRAYNEDTGAGTLGFGSLQYRYDDFLLLGENGTSLISLGNGIALGNAFTSDNLYSGSVLAATANGGSQPRYHAPANFTPGSSIAHWDEGDFPAGNDQSLMTPQIGPGEAIHNPGTITLGLFADMGWSVCASLEDDPCITWQDPSPTTGYSDFNTAFGGAPCDDGSGCPFNEITGFQVWASEAYAVNNFQEGGTYTFSICNGSGAGTWVPDFTIISPSGIVEASGPGTGCAITWTASEDGTYLIVINEAGACGEANSINNGFPALTCADGTTVCDDLSDCSTPPLVFEGPDAICPDQSTTVNLSAPATVPDGGGLRLQFINTATNTGINLNGATFPFTFNSDLNGLLSANGFAAFEGTYALNVFVYSDASSTAAINGSICASGDTPIELTFYEEGAAECLEVDEPCLTWQDPSPVTGWSDFNDIFGGAPCDDGDGCPFNEIDDFQVWASEAYAVDNFIAGGTYTFSMCNGPGAGSWVPEFTIIAPSGEVDAFGLGTGCSITWTATESGTYLILINEVGSCGIANSINNGYPALTCVDGTAECDAGVACDISPMELEGNTSLCPGESGTVVLTAPAILPPGAGLGILFSDAENGGFLSLTGIEFPFSFDNDLNGLLSANDLDLLEGEVGFTLFAYTDPGNVAGSVCSIGQVDFVVNFLAEDDPLCDPTATCVAPDPVIIGSAELCPGETSQLGSLSAPLVPDGGGLGVQFFNTATQATVELTDIGLPLTLDNDLGGVLSANDIDALEGQYEVFFFIYTNPADIGGSLCATGTGTATINFLSSDDPLCAVEPEPCLTWVDPSPTTGYTNFNTTFGGAPCDDGDGCPFNEITGFQAWAGEAYAVNDFQEGGTYTFSICNGPGAGSWVPEFTIIAPSGAVDAFGAGTGCSITWTASESGAYFIVINEAGNCGVANSINNGFPALTCEDGTAVCEPQPECEIFPMELQGSASLCPGETATVVLTAPAVLPAGAALGILFSDADGQGFLNLTGVTFPYVFDNDLNGLLSANNIDLLEGEVGFTLFAYTNPGNVGGSICSFGEVDFVVNFLAADDPLCDPLEPCTAPDPLVLGPVVLCPGETSQLGSASPPEIPEGGGIGVQFVNLATEAAAGLSGISLPFTFDNDLGGVLSANDMDPFEGEYEVFFFIYTDPANVSASLCDIGNGIALVTFLSADDPQCTNEPEPCNAGSLAFIEEGTELCPGEVLTLINNGEVEVPEGGIYTVFATYAGETFVLEDVLANVAYTVDHTLGGLIPDGMEGEVSFTALAYASDNEESLCSESNTVVVTFLPADEWPCFINSTANSAIGAVNLYPNPARDEVQLDFRLRSVDKTAISIIDVSGRLVQSINVNPQLGHNKQLIETNQLAPGFYSVVLRSGDYIATKALVIQH